MKKHLIAIIIASLACIACGFGAFLFSNQISNLEQDIVTMKQEVHDLEGQAARLSPKKQNVSTGANVGDLNEYFIDEDGALGFVEYIEGLASSAGLTYRINLFDSEQNADLAKYDKEFLKMSLTTTGSIANTRNFVSLIESLPYNIKITRVDLKGSSTGAKDAPWTMAIDFSAVKIMGKN